MFKYLNGSFVHSLSQEAVLTLLGGINDEKISGKFKNNVKAPQTNRHNQYVARPLIIYCI